MTETAGAPTTLSRASDHLGNLANILKDLGGGGTLLHELTQNANDAEADRITFIASHEELTVWNSAVFTDCGHQEDSKRCPWKIDERSRSCDLHSFREVAGRHKADDARTTGAFGVGFTAVYQVTDHPEVVTAGLHLILDESRPEDERIMLCPGSCTRDHIADGTTFYLPWARVNTPLRRELGAQPLADTDVARLIDELHDAAGAALVFLTDTQSLTVDSPERTSQAVRRRRGNRITITLNDESSEWLLLEGEAEGAAQLRHDHDPDSQRSTVVQVAVPVEEAVVGRIFADLPTETRTGWSGHINATFFPRQDRKGVEFGIGGFRGKWNDILVDAAAVLIAENLENIAEELGYRVAWNYLVDVERVNREIAKDGYPTVFSSFFERAKELAPSCRIALLADDSAELPDGTLIPRDEEEYEAADPLLRLNVPIVSPSIRPLAQQTAFTQYGMSILRVDDVVSALQALGVMNPWQPGEADAPLTDAEVESLLRLIDHLQERGKQVLVTSGIADVAIVPCVDGKFAAATQVSRLEEEDRALFELLAPDLMILDTDRLAARCPSLMELCDDITPARAVAIFEADPEALAVAPDQVLEWLDNHRGALAPHADRVSALPIFPSTRGDLRPLDELSLPSDFDDLLGLADVVDREKTAGHADLLRLLGAKELDAVQYLVRHVAPAAVDGLTPDQARQVLEIIHRHRVELEQVPGTMAILRETPLIPSSAGMQAAHRVHLPNPALSLIAPEAPVAHTSDMASHLIDTLLWLGVSAHPNDEVLNQAALRLGDQEAAPDPDVVLAILNALPNPHESDTVPASLRSLTTAPWLPAEEGGRAKPDNIYATFQRFLFASQGPKLALSQPDQNRLAAVLEWLGVRPRPSTAMVIAHLRHCVATGSSLHPEAYRALGQAKEESTVRALTREACVQISDGVFVEPSTVFWSDPGLGEWAHVLAPGNRSFQDFFDRVGVSETAEPVHVEEMLRRISRAAGNTRLDDETKRVVHRCWELLDQHLPESKDALTRLGAIKSAVGPRDLLEKPAMLLFADGRGLATRILLIRDNLIRRDRSTQRALAAAGVLPAEAVITPHINEEATTAPASSLAALVRDRMPALERLTEAQREENGAEYRLKTLLEIDFELVPELAVEYVTRFANQRQVDSPQPTDAIYLPDAGRLIVRTELPNRHIARELALCIAPDVDVSLLAPSILEVLSATDLEDARRALNDYGVRDLDETVWEHVESQETADVHDLDLGGDPSGPDDVSLDGTTDPFTPPDGPAPEVGPEKSAESQGSAGGGAPGSGSGKGSRTRRRQSGGQRRTHMVSYVSYDDEDRDDDEWGDEAPHNSAVDAAGVRRVLEYERSCGRVPEEQTHSNPGFDVLSRDRNGTVVRRIEIKSIGGPWTGFGVWMSATQLEENRNHQDEFWLYVVEHAEDDDAAVIHRIHNPVGEATKFGFDTGWQALGEPDVERDDIGRPLVNSTRRLLGWSTSENAKTEPGTDS